MVVLGIGTLFPSPSSFSLSSSSTTTCRRRKRRRCNDCVVQGTVDGIMFSMRRGIPHRILLAVCCVPISWIPDLERHLVACSTLARRLNVEKALSQTRALVKIQNKGSKCYRRSHVWKLRKRKWHSRRGSSPKAVVLAFPDLSHFLLFHATPSVSSLELCESLSIEPTMADYSDLFTLARSTDAFIPPTDALADPFYVQKLNRLQRSWIE